MKELILKVLRKDIFKFDNSFYQQTKVTAMGTPMAPNYTNIFMDKVECNMINDFQHKTGLKPILWFKYIDDIFFITSYGKDSFDQFIQFAQSYSDSKIMKFHIKYEVHHRVHNT